MSLTVFFPIKILTPEANLISLFPIILLSKCHETKYNCGVIVSLSYVNQQFKIIASENYLTL